MQILIEIVYGIDFFFDLIDSSEVPAVSTIDTRRGPTVKSYVTRARYNAVRLPLLT
jgi:hypothetical protein